MTFQVCSLAVAIALATCPVGEAIDCTPNTADPYCKCSGSDFALDLSKLSIPLHKIPDNSPNLHGVYEYIFAPCPTVDCTKAGDSSGVACQSLTGGGEELFIARRVQNVQPVWSVATLDPLEFTVTYCEGDIAYGYQERCAVVTFKHDASQSGIIASMDGETSTDTQLLYNFRLQGKGISAVQAGGGGGGGVAAGVVGWVLMSIFIAAVLTYFIAGMAVNYNRGTRGCEMVPNATFWQDLPLLIKDGFLFTISPCYKRESYQKF